MRNGMAVDELHCPDLQTMMDACRAESLSPLICSSYRTQEDQETLFSEYVEQLMEHCWEYGFILRYLVEIAQAGLCLEEFYRSGDETCKGLFVIL